MNQETAKLLAFITVELKELQTLQQDLAHLTELKNLIIQREHARIDFNRKAIA